MEDEDKTRGQLSHDLADMRPRLDDLEALESKRHWQEQQEAQKLRTAAQYIALIFLV